MSYTILTTGKCKNNCRICGLAGKPNLEIYHAGKTKQERKGIENLIKSFDQDSTVALTGGDPLLSPFVELVGENHKGRKAIVLNPLTFLYLELGKAARNISKEEAENLIKRVKEEKRLSPKLQELAYHLSKFDSIDASTGSMQSPNPWIIKFADSLFHDFLYYGKLNLKKPVNFREINDKSKVGCAGRIRKLVEQGRIKGKKAEKMSRFNTCGSYFTKNVFYFKKEKDAINLFFSPCCMVGVNPYICFKTDLTLEEMAETEPEHIKQRMEEEYERMLNKGLYILLTRSRIKERETKGLTSSTDVEYGFKSYLKIAEEFLKGESIIKNTYTFKKNEECSACEACYTLGIMLHRAGVSPDEWQSYVQEKFEESFRIKYSKRKSNEEGIVHPREVKMTELEKNCPVRIELIEV